MDIAAGQDHEDPCFLDAEQEVDAAFAEAIDSANEGEGDIVGGGRGGGFNAVDAQSAGGEAEEEFVTWRPRVGISGARTEEHVGVITIGEDGLDLYAIFGTEL